MMVQQLPRARARAFSPLPFFLGYCVSHKHALPGGDVRAAHRAARHAAVVRARAAQRHVAARHEQHLQRGVQTHLAVVA